MNNPENQNTQPSIEVIPDETTSRLLAATAFGLVGVAEVSAATPLVKDAAEHGKEFAVKTVDTIKPVVQEAAQRGKETGRYALDSVAVATFGLRKFIAARRVSSAEKNLEDNKILPGLARANWLNSPAISPRDRLAPVTKRQQHVAYQVGRVKKRTHRRQMEIRRLERVNDVEGNYKKIKEAEKKKVIASIVYTTGENGRPNLGTGIDSSGRNKNTYVPPPPEKDYIGSAAHKQDISKARMHPSERKYTKKDYKRVRRMKGQGIKGKLNPVSLPRDRRRATRHFDKAHINKRTRRDNNRVNKSHRQFNALNAKQNQRQNDRDARMAAARARRQSS